MFNFSGFGGPGGDQSDQTESAAILKIKESMQEEAKRFEKDSDHPDYFMQWKNRLLYPISWTQFLCENENDGEFAKWIFYMTSQKSFLIL